MSDLSVVNVVGGGTLNRELDLRQVYIDFPDGATEYEPETFPAVVIRFDSPKGTIMLYSSGKYSLAGAQSIKDAHELNEKFVEAIRNILEEELEDIHFETRYLVGTANLGFELDLSNIIPLLGIEHTEYEPEQFPGLFYRPPNQNWFCILFTSGKVVFSGVKDTSELKTAFEEVSGSTEVLNR